MHALTTKGFIGCDWGSSNFRLALLNCEGEVIQEYADAGGVVALRQQGLDTDGLVDHLRNGLTVLAGKCTMDISALPLIISGMAGSSLGISEVPYATLPFSYGNNGQMVHNAGRLNGIPHQVSIIAGVCSEEDVMRGEETEAVGLIHSAGLKEALLILPGTHSKHLTIKDGRVSDFKTHMTGELFQVISTGTILRHALNEADPFDDHGRSCFLEGMKMARSSDLLHVLFTLRSHILLKQRPILGNIHRLSGLLIGYELNKLSDNEFNTIVLGGEGALYECYRFALAHTGAATRVMDLPSKVRRQAVWNGQFLMLRSHNISV